MIQANSINSSYDTGVYRITDLIIFPGPKKSVKSDQKVMLWAIFTEYMPDFFKKYKFCLS